MRFQSTLSLRRATRPAIKMDCLESNFNPRSPCGERRDPKYRLCAVCGFQSTLSLRRATSNVDLWRIKTGRFQSTLSLRRATGWDFAVLHAQLISIHALLAESDPTPKSKDIKAQEFQSTLSLRRATGALPQLVPRHFNFNPRSPCGERHSKDVAIMMILLFQSTLSLRRATFLLASGPRPILNFNPRSPCGERLDSGSNGERWINFNPRSPCGERPLWYDKDADISVFQSTLSLRRATWGISPSLLT